MYVNREAIKAGKELIRALKGAHVRHRVIWGLDSATVLELHRILLSDPEGESRHLKSILSRELPFNRTFIRENLRLYTRKRAAVHAIVQAAKGEIDTESDAGEVFRWLRFQFKSRDLEACANVLEIVSRWENPSDFMCLTFLRLHDYEVLETVRTNPELLERLIQVLNENSVESASRGITCRIDIDHRRLLEAARSHSTLQEGAL